MNKVETVIRSADQGCQANDVCLTVKRKQVLAGPVKSDKALSAYDLVDFYKEESDAIIPVMLVYRILEFLEKQHLVHKLKLESKYVACS
ncbi:transcriptional repressor [Spartinivicinus poritis]|uniref:Uncharacterized protein n=1 Tax=Spartinivicinus poritis TaxID=2994640 RepID=A0ABT5U511_9GAMM|nr:transcriptional repressor [Spartinivicinus sp. A2-2]MDE1461310.1 hypothetical protein [Spartinivicinus sp. A2-2]